MSIIGFCVLCESMKSIPIIKFNNKKRLFGWGSNVYDTNNFIFDGILSYDQNKKYYRKIANHTSVSLSPLKLFKVLRDKINISYVEFSSNYKRIASKIKPSKSTAAFRNQMDYCRLVRTL